MLITIFFSLSLILTAQAEWHGRIINVKENKKISRSELLKNLSSSHIIVLGEKHFTKEVQDEEGKIISDVVSFTKKEQDFSLFWEFLNASSQTETKLLFQQVLESKISTEDFLVKTQGSKKAVIYAPMIDATVKFGGRIFGGNLSREEKAPVLVGGLGALDPNLLPPYFKLGGADYLERFTEVMRSHATPEQISNYFVAQSLVDDAIAYHLLRDSQTTLNFLVIGAFHSMYSDGVVSRLRERDPSTQIVNIEILDCSDFTLQEMEDFIFADQYGERSDYMVFVNEPKRS